MWKTELAENYTMNWRRGMPSDRMSIATEYCNYSKASDLEISVDVITEDENYNNDTF